MNASAGKAPWHLWVIGVLSTLWNAVGAFDYTATQLRLEFYMSQFTAEQLEYFYGFPAWFDGVWAIAVWTSLLGSLALLLRKSWAVWLFGISIVGLSVSTYYNFHMSNGMEIMGQEGAIFTGVIWVIMICLFFYARAMKARGVLR